MMDGDGTMRHLKFPGSYSEQPALDIEIYRIIRGEWNRLRNEDMKARTRGG